MTNFERYPSIENSYQQKVIDRIEVVASGVEDLEWIVSEKIHGCNFGVTMTKGEPLKFSKRSGFIGDDNFMGINNGFRDFLIENYGKHQEHLDSAKYPYETITFYGELMGGHEAKSDVREYTSKKIQSGVLYTPFNEFAVFDIKVDGEYLEDEAYSTLMYDLMVLSFGKGPFPVPMLGAFGTLQEALAYEVEGVDSKVLCKEGNEWEGVVIKPSKELTIFGDRRVILKKKTKKFLEDGGNKVKAPPVPLDSQQQTLFDLGVKLVCDNRFNNVLSKEGLTTEELEPKILGKVIGLFSKDVYNDFVKDNEDSLAELEDKSKKHVTKLIQGESAKFVKKKVFGYK